MAAIRHNLHQLAARIRIAGQRVVNAMPQIQRACGVQILSWGYQDYRGKARGQTVQGVRWDAIKRGSMAARLRKLGWYRALDKEGKTSAINDALASYEIGVDTGRQINRLRVADSDNLKFQGFELIVSVGTSYAEHFDARRPIFGPNFIDAPRQARLEQITEQMAQRLVDDQLED